MGAPFGGGSVHVGGGAWSDRPPVQGAQLVPVRVCCSASVGVSRPMTHAASSHPGIFWMVTVSSASQKLNASLDEIVLPDGGRRQEFQQGAIYVAFQNAVGSAIQNGPLRDKYNSVGGLTPGSSFLGYLTEDHKRTLPNTTGQMARFQNGVIYWSPSTGAYPISGAILSRWAAAGYEQSEYGYPTGDAGPGDEPGSTQQVFRTGSIYSAGDYFRGLIIPAGQEQVRDFQPYEVTGHPPYGSVDLSDYGVLGGTQEGAIAGQGNVAAAEPVQQYFDTKGYSLASQFWSHFYDNTGTNVLISTPRVDEITDPSYTAYSDVPSASEILTANREDAILRAIALADAQQRQVKVIVSTGWRVAGAAADYPDHVFALGRYSVAGTTSVIASPGPQGQHQIKYQQGRSIYDVYDFEINETGYDEYQQAAINTGAAGVRYGVAKPFLNYGDGTIKSYAGVR